MRREKQTRYGKVPAEQDTDPRLATQGLVNLIPPPCESHGGGIEVDEPFWSSGVCAVRPSKGGERWPSGRRQRRRAERNHFLDSETPRPPVDSSTRQEPEVLSTVESSTAGLDRPLGRDLSLSSII